MDYNSSSALSKSETERDSSVNSPTVFHKKVASRKISVENKGNSNDHFPTGRVNSFPHGKPHTENSGGISNRDIIKAKKKNQEFSKGNRRESIRKVFKPVTEETDHEKNFKNMKLRNERNAQSILKSKEANKARESLVGSVRNEVNRQQTQHINKRDIAVDLEKRCINNKRIKKKNNFGNSKIKEVLEEVESTINKRDARVRPKSISPSSALDQPKSPTSFLQENGDFSLQDVPNKRVLDKQEQNQEPFPTSSGYHTTNTFSVSTPGSSKILTSPSEEADVMKVVISNTSSLPMFFHRMDFGAPAKAYNYPPPQKTNNVPRGANPFTLDSFPDRYHPLKEYVDLEWLQDGHSTDSSHLLASPSSTNNSQGSQFLTSTSSRSSSLWSKYEDMDQNNIAQYGYILRKYGGSLNFEPRKISHVQKNKMDLSASKKSTSKSYAMDHAKRMLIKLKNVTGNDFELLHERELEDEIISGVKAPKKLPPIGLVTHEEPPTDKKYDYKPNSLKDFRTLPKVRTVPASSNLSEQQLREMVERAEKKKSLDQAIRERNRERFGNHRHIAHTKSNAETTATS